jgi:hypothetical protein
MDLEECRKKYMVKNIKPDNNLMKSLVKSSAKKLQTGELIELNDTTASSKITLVYDSLRELLEAIAVSRGYKIYNHECYSAFLREVLRESYLADRFNDFRKIRNSINYYGKEVGVDESRSMLKGMSDIIAKLKNKIS